MTLYWSEGVEELGLSFRGKREPHLKFMNINAWIVRVGSESLKIFTIVFNKLAIVVTIPQGFERIFIRIRVLVIANKRF